MPSEEMVFMKRTIFPFLIKVRPSLRDSAFSLRFPAENFRMVKFLPEKRSESAGTDVRGIQKAKTATDVVHVRQGKELSGSPFSCRTPA